MHPSGGGGGRWGELLIAILGGGGGDVQIVKDSDFINPKYHAPGEQILADRGFTQHEDFAATCSAELPTPAFTKGKNKLPAQDVEMSRKISSVSIHIEERVIGLIKNDLVSFSSGEH